MEYHPFLHHAHRQMQRRFGKPRTGTIAQFARVYGDQIMPDAAREHFMTISVHLNPRSSVGTRIAFNQKDAAWYDELCDTLGVDALEWRGQPIHEVRPVTRLASLQPIRPRPAYQPDQEEEKIGQKAHGLPYRAPSFCQPGTFRRRQERYRKLAVGMGSALTDLLVDGKDVSSWNDVKTTLRNRVRMHQLVRSRVDETTSLHDHLTERTVAACKSAVAKEKSRIQRLLALRQRARRLTDQQHVGSSKSGHASLGDDELSDTEEDSLVGSSSSYAMDESTRLEMDSLPAQIERALADHLLYHEPELRQSFSFLPFAADTARKRVSAAAVKEAMRMPEFVPTKRIGQPALAPLAQDEDMPGLMPIVASHYYDADDYDDYNDSSHHDLEEGQQDEGDEDAMSSPRPVTAATTTTTTATTTTAAAKATETAYGTATLSRRLYEGDTDADDSMPPLARIDSSAAGTSPARASAPAPAPARAPAPAPARAPARAPAPAPARAPARPFPGTVTVGATTDAPASKPAATVRVHKAPIAVPIRRLKQQQQQQQQQQYEIDDGVQAPEPAAKKAAPTAVRFAKQTQSIGAPAAVAVPKVVAKKAAPVPVPAPAAPTTPSVEDSGVFFQNHFYSKELFEYALKHYNDQYKKIAAAYEEKPIHVALEHHTIMSRRNKALMIREATTDDGENLLAYVATMHVRPEHCSGVPAFKLVNQPDFLFHDAEQVQQKAEKM